MLKKKKSLRLDGVNLVGTIHTREGFGAAARAELDAVELRADAFVRPPDGLRLAALTQPVILTVRRFDEGGGRRQTDRERREAYLGLLDSAAAVDVELRSLDALEPVIKAARDRGKILIVSFHDFTGTPGARRLNAICAAAREGGADIVKVATRTDKAAEVGRLLALLDRKSGPLAVMGMGALGKASRLLLAKAGSTLNYGWLGRPQVPGQWNAVEFGKLLART